MRVPESGQLRLGPGVSTQEEVVVAVKTGVLKQARTGPVGIICTDVHYIDVAGCIASDIPAIDSFDVDPVQVIQSGDWIDIEANEVGKEATVTITVNSVNDNPTAGTRTFTLTQIQDSGGVANSGSDTATLQLTYALDGDSSVQGTFNMCHPDAEHRRTGLRRLRVLAEAFMSASKQKGQVVLSSAALPLLLAFGVLGCLLLARVQAQLRMGAMLRSTRTRIARRLLTLARGDATQASDARASVAVSQEALAMMLGRPV